MYRSQKRSLTLIEVILCVALIAAAGSLFSIKAKQLWARHCFFADIDRLCEELTLTRHFVQSLRSDVDLYLLRQPDGVRMVRHFDEPGMKKMKNAFPAEIIFKNIAIDQDYSLFFYGNGWHDLTREIRIQGLEKITLSLLPERFASKKFVK